jgi:hypothetical protein
MGVHVIVVEVVVSQLEMSRFTITVDYHRWRFDPRVAEEAAAAAASSICTMLMTSFMTPWNGMMSWSFILFELDEDIVCVKRVKIW